MSKPRPPSTIGMSSSYQLSHAPYKVETVQSVAQLKPGGELGIALQSTANYSPVITSSVDQSTPNGEDDLGATRCGAVVDSQDNRKLRWCR